jgi:ribosomal protein S18 acetylase RimI-like enzyme
METEKKTLTIRNAIQYDLGRCFEIETLCYHGHGATRERIERRIASYPEGFLVGVWAGSVIGFVNSGCFLVDDIRDEKLKDLDGHDPAGENLVIFSVAVHPDYQERGFAHQLMSGFIDTARSLGKESILLVCRENLMRFYRSFGFAYRAPSALSFGGHVWFEMALPLSSASL